MRTRKYLSSIEARLTVFFLLTFLKYTKHMNFLDPPRQEFKAWLGSRSEAGKERTTQYISEGVTAMGAWTACWGLLGGEQKQT